MCQSSDLKLKKVYYEKIGRKDYNFILKEKLGDFTKYEQLGGYKKACKNNYMSSFENAGVIFPDLTNRCECTHKISIDNNCYIRHIETKKILVVGNCCINKFQIKKKCSLCQSIHKRFKSHICTTCEKVEKFKSKEAIKQFKELEKIKKRKVLFGKYKSLTIHEVYDRDLNYFNWCVSKYNEYLKTIKNIDDDIKHAALCKSNMFNIFNTYNELLKQTL